MNLKEVRTRFVNLSGRFDLVKSPETMEDNGANYFIEAGHRLLDSMFTSREAGSVVELTTESGKAEYLIEKLFSITGITDSSNSFNLVHRDLDDATFDDTSTGRPKEYIILPDKANAGATELKSFRVRLQPIPDAEYVLRVNGRRREELKEDTAVSFWTVNYPETLISAALYQVERFHRNTAGMRDYMNSIREDLRQIDGNAIESSLGSRTQMNDSFNFTPEGNEW